MKHALSEASLPRGFRFAATACGLKKTGALDLAILSSDVPASAAAVFTQNLVAAAPVAQLALPAFTTAARMRPFDARRCCLEMRTGAAATIFCVKTAAADAGTSLERIERSSLSLIHI